MRRRISKSSFDPAADGGGTGTRGTVQVPSVGEADVVVVDALVGRPERLALLERHVPPIVLPRGEGDTSTGTPHPT
jgi:hypothetical protein